MNHKAVLLCASMLIALSARAEDEIIPKDIKAGFAQTEFLPSSMEIGGSTFRFSQDALEMTLEGCLSGLLDTSAALKKTDLSPSERSELESHLERLRYDTMMALIGAGQYAHKTDTLFALLAKLDEHADLIGPITVTTPSDLMYAMVRTCFYQENNPGTVDIDTAAMSPRGFVYETRARILAREQK